MCDRPAFVRFHMNATTRWKQLTPELHRKKGAGLTPSQDVVPEELLLPDKHGHYDERVEVDAFTQHPEVIGSRRVLRQHSQDLTAHLTDGER